MPNDEPVEVLQRVPHPGWMRDNKHSLRKSDRTRRLDARDAQIRADYEKMFPKSIHRLGKKYCLSHQQINNIVRGSRTWTYPRRLAEGTEGQ